LITRPAIDLLKSPANGGVSSARRLGDAVNLRQMRGDEVEDRCGLLAPPHPVDSRAGDRLLDGDDDLELFGVLTVRQRRFLIRAVPR
jgi:hypothetical protein